MQEYIALRNQEKCEKLTKKNRLKRSCYNGHAKIAVSPSSLSFQIRRERKRNETSCCGRAERATDAKNSAEGVGEQRAASAGISRRKRWSRKLLVSNHRRILWDHNSACRRSVEVLKDSLATSFPPSFFSPSLSPPVYLPFFPAALQAASADLASGDSNCFTATGHFRRARLPSLAQRKLFFSYLNFLIIFLLQKISCFLFTPEFSKVSQ